MTIDGQDSLRSKLNSLSIDIESILVNSSGKVAVGSYVGTGTCGQSNPNKLTFEFAPKYVIVGNQLLMHSLQASATKISGGGYAVSVEWNDKTVSWYAMNSNASSTAPADQCNYANSTYCYIAFG